MRSQCRLILGLILGWTIALFVVTPNVAVALCKLDPLELALPVAEMNMFPGVSVSEAVLRISFLPESVAGRPAARLRSELFAKMPGVDAYFAGEAMRQMPAAGTNENVFARNFNVTLDDAGRILVAFGIRYEKWAVAIWDMPCNCGFKWPPCDMCRQEAKTLLVRVDPSVDITVTPKFGPTGKDIAIDVSTHVDPGLSGEQRTLYDALRFLSFRSIPPTPASQVISAKLAMPGKLQDYLPPAPAETIKLQTRMLESLIGQSVRFGGDAAVRTLTAVWESDTIEAASEMCRLRQRLNEEVIYAGGPSLPQAVEVKKGDSLWKLAERAYGDGRLHWALAAANRDQLRGGAVVQPGGELKISPIKSLEERMIMVRHGETLWGVAKERLGSGARYPELVRPPANAIANPNRIYPLQGLIPEQ